MRIKIALFLLALLPTIAISQVETRRTFVGRLDFSGMAAGGTSDYTGEIRNFNDQSGLNFAVDMLPGDVIWDNFGNRWEVMVINSATLITADIDIRDINGSGSPPVGAGFVSRESSRGLSGFVPDNATGVSQQLKAVVETHNALEISNQVDSLQAVIDSLEDKWLATELPIADVLINANGNRLDIEGLDKLRLIGGGDREAELYLDHNGTILTNTQAGMRTDSLSSGAAIWVNTEAVLGNPSRYSAFMKATDVGDPLTGSFMNMLNTETTVSYVEGGAGQTKWELNDSSFHVGRRELLNEKILNINTDNPSVSFFENSWYLPNAVPDPAPDTSFMFLIGPNSAGAGFMTMAELATSIGTINPDLNGLFDVANDGGQIPANMDALLAGRLTFEAASDGNELLEINPASNNINVQVGSGQVFFGDANFDGSSRTWAEVRTTGTAGQHRFQTIGSAYFGDVEGFGNNSYLYVYDPSTYATFNNMDVGIRQFNPTAGLDVNSNARIRNLPDSLAAFVTMADSSGYLYRIPPDQIGLQGSGTTNFVTKWTGPSTLGNSQIQDDGTLAGVGGTESGFKFTVRNGDLRVDAGSGSSTDRIELYSDNNPLIKMFNAGTIDARITATSGSLSGVSNSGLQFGFPSTSSSIGLSGIVTSGLMAVGSEYRLYKSGVHDIRIDGNTNNYLRVFKSGSDDVLRMDVNNSNLSVGKSDNPQYTIDIDDGGIRLDGQSTSPTGAAGVIYYHSTNNEFYYHNGTEWRVFTGLNNDVTDGYYPRRSGNSLINGNLDDGNAGVLIREDSGGEELVYVGKYAGEQRFTLNRDVRFGFGHNNAGTDGGNSDLMSYWRTNGTSLVWFYVNDTFTAAYRQGEVTYGGTSDGGSYNLQSQNGIYLHTGDFRMASASQQIEWSDGNTHIDRSDGMEFSEATGRFTFKKANGTLEYITIDGNNSEEVRFHQDIAGGDIGQSFNISGWDGSAGTAGGDLIVRGGTGQSGVDGSGGDLYLRGGDPNEAASTNTPGKIYLQTQEAGSTTKYTAIRIENAGYAYFLSKAVMANLSTGPTGEAGAVYFDTDDSWYRGHDGTSYELFAKASDIPTPIWTDNAGTIHPTAGTEAVAIGRTSGVTDRTLIVQDVNGNGSSDYTQEWRNNSGTVTAYFTGQGRLVITGQNSRAIDIENDADIRFTGSAGGQIQWGSGGPYIDQFSQGVVIRGSSSTSAAALTVRGGSTDFAEFNVDNGLEINEITTYTQSGNLVISGWNGGSGTAGGDVYVRGGNATSNNIGTGGDLYLRGGLPNAGATTDTSGVIVFQVADDGIEALTTWGVLDDNGWELKEVEIRNGLTLAAQSTSPTAQQGIMYFDPDAGDGDWFKGHDGTDWYRFAKQPDSSPDENASVITYDTDGSVQFAGPAWGEMAVWVSDPDTVTITSGTFAKWTDWTQSNMSNFTYSSGRLTYTGTSTATFKITCTGSFSYSVDDTEVTFKLYEDGSGLADSEVVINYTDANGKEPFAVSSLVIMNQNDYIEIFADADTNGDLYIHSSNLNVTKLN